MRITEITKELESRGHKVGWPVTGQMLMDGAALDVSRILIEADNVDEAADYIEQIAYLKS